MANVRKYVLNADTVTDPDDVLIEVVDDLIFKVGDNTRWRTGAGADTFYFDPNLKMLTPWPGVTDADLGGVDADNAEGWANIYIGSTDGVRITSGSGTPEAAVTAPVGSLFLRVDGGASTTLYIKESGAGNTGWVAK